MGADWDGALWLGDVAAWFDGAARDLPWRAEPRDPWSVLVSEVMLQQTPVSRVVPAYEAWLERWPDPAALAADPPGESLRMWGRLGYPRRALRLHAAATAIVDRHDGRLPTTYDELIALPGIGDYTASAVLAFAHKRRIPVLDTNVRRVVARAQGGQALPSTSSPTRAERERLAEQLPAEDAAAAYVSEALMELGALVCTARSPACAACPVVGECVWWALGRPANQAPTTTQAKFEGSDRQVRGLIMGVLRGSDAPVDQALVNTVWPDAEQRARAQTSLEADGLITVSEGRLSLPQR